ncbi:MAG: hypothetical protein AAF389_14910 [Gemmatimonadota bacterium]
MTTLATFLGDLSDTHKAVTALIGAVAIGSTLTFYLVGFTGLPERMDKAEAAIGEIREHVEESDRRFDHLVCLLTLEGRDEMSAQELIRECGL